LILPALLLLLTSTSALAAEYTVTPDMTPQQVYTTIESARAGDTVLIQPGTYQVRIYLSNSGTPDNPITIKGSDPDNRPVFDYAGRDCDQWPGSNAGRIHIWAWQIQASDVTLENLIIRNAKYSKRMSSAAIFMGPETIYKEPTPPETIPSGIVLRNIKMHDNDEGLQGTAEGTLVEHCELYNNGRSEAANPKHNVYLQGGSAVFRFCKFYNPLTGANLTLRTRECRIEYSEIGAFVSSHSIQVLTNKAQQVNGQPYRQTITLIGNRLSGVRTGGKQMSKFIILHNSNKYAGTSMFLNMYYNTFEGAEGNSGALVQLKHDTGTRQLGANIYNNLVLNNTHPVFIAPAHSMDDPMYSVDIRFNWWSEGDYSRWAGVMNDNYFGGDPEIEARGRANAAFGKTPMFEPLGAARTAAGNLGAFSKGVFRHKMNPFAIHLLLDE